MRDSQHKNSVSDMSDDKRVGYRIDPVLKQYGQDVSVDERTQETLGIGAWLQDQTVWDICDYDQFRIGFIWVGGWRGQKVLVAKVPLESAYPGWTCWRTVRAGRSEELDSLEGHFEAAMLKSIRNDYREVAAHQRGVQVDPD